MSCDIRAFASFVSPIIVLKAISSFWNSPRTLTTCMANSFICDTAKTPAAVFPMLLKTSSIRLPSFTAVPVMPDKIRLDSSASVRNCELSMPVP